ncbi:unnamed protein product [Spirodela intermedia]|uniref:Uncharacterized protein n=1 Tax=Spirodela intermedia TaxID=51605 RepID=A0A7I8JSB6_SPIIN|nr:unnamed protein product [Spirodela intermedia]CAA6672655.1 unnamed protein product [Spirodela intermedia]
MDLKYHTLVDHSTWNIVPHPIDANIIMCNGDEVDIFVTKVYFHMHFVIIFTFYYFYFNNKKIC